MQKVIDLEEGRLLLAVKRGYRNWKSRFNEDFGIHTRLCHISRKTLNHLAQGGDKGAFYLYDLIMGLKDLGSGFEFNELDPESKMAVIDLHLFLLDRIRFEYMKRLGWLESYPGEEYTLVELITRFDTIGPGLQARIPVLSRNHPRHREFFAINTFDREGFIRKLIPGLMKEIKRYSETL
ncbi:MAG: hypothetical protein JRF51_05860 [Deltaproteobacteria bacterium]|nr:hypothetical protein [Deltaproteobacteria bacterium]MBW2112362.1 hypothetical protein [Deltaproteobacteria bacterium]MBW2352742.1 hypothetical protein [Deltaproteobacteria bacterium]HDZ91395.1 hypothetical protein [Deltaproteobacteria bacterium]